MPPAPTGLVSHPIGTVTGNDRFTKRQARRRASPVWGFHVYDTNTTGGWAERHGVTLDAVLVDKDDGTERWLVTAATPKGVLSVTVDTDGSYSPDPFDQLFGVWNDLPPDEGELARVVAVVGTEAVAELALLVGW